LKVLVDIIHDQSPELVDILVNFNEGRFSS
jgi:hypothetical protein